MHRDPLRDVIWRAGVGVAHLGKRRGVPASVHEVIERLGLFIVPPPTGDIVASLESDIELAVPPAGFSRSYAMGVYEEEVTRLIKRLVRPGMRFVDVGAFCGYYTLLVSKLLGSGGHVYSFEADPDNYAYLMANIRWNGSMNITARQTAILDAVDRVSLIRGRYRDRHWISGGGSSGATTHRAGSTAVRVDATTLDTFFAAARWPAVHLVKLDIEGAEPDALRGMTELSRRNPDLQIILEHHESNLRRRGVSPGQLWSALSDLGFRRGYVIEDGMRPLAIHPGQQKIRFPCNLWLTRT